MPALKVAVLCLTMNSVPVSFGAVGTPTWFGFAPLGLDEATLQTVGFQTALLHGFAALFVPAAALRFIATWREIFAETGRRIRGPVIALLGALVFVQLMVADGERASTILLGRALADGMGDSWRYVAPFLGTLGSFFSGSNTISNLTFGSIQMSVAETSGLEVSVTLALQSAGAAMGNMVCIHNIVAVCAVLGISRQEGAILKQTVRPLLLYGAALAAAVWIWV